MLLTCAVGEVVAVVAQTGAARVARREVGESVSSTHRLHVVHVALASEVARRGQVDFKGLALVAERRNSDVST